MFAELFLFDPKSPITFNTGLFLWLFAAFYLIYWWLVRRGESESYGLPVVEGIDAEPLPSNHHTKLVFVTLFSWYFYYKSSGMFFLLLMWATVLDYNLAHWIARTERDSARKSAIFISVISNLGLLFYFKYTNFFIDCLQVTGLKTNHLAIFLPVGISFYTFQSISYIVDVYTKKLKPVDNILEYAFFVSFFPQLVAGPIVRAYDFIPQINQTTKLSKADFGRAVFLIIGGLFKKVIIADYIALNFVDRIFENPLLYTGFENLMGMYGYALRIYCDFSGYSDMAIAIALLLGFHFPLNFDSPYQSASVTEFWRRWHISLSSWLRDYVYIPLGGNKNGALNTYINLMATMLIGGFWHGAAWRFVLWGALHGIALAVERFFKQYIRLPQNAFFHAIRVILVFHFVCLCWLPFCASDIKIVFAMLSQIFTAFHAEIIPSFVQGYSSVLLLMAIGYFFHFIPKDIEFKAETIITNAPVFLKALSFVIMVWLVVQVKSAEIQPFIYFQF